MSSELEQEVRPLSDEEIASIDAWQRVGLGLLHRYGHDVSQGFSPDALDASLGKWRDDTAGDRPDEEAVSSGIGCLFGHYVRQSFGGSFVMVTDVYGTSFGVDTGPGGISFPIDSVRKRLHLRDAPLGQLFAHIRQMQETVAAGGAAERSPALDLDKVYPYIVHGELYAGGMAIAIGHDVYVTIAMDLDGLCRTVGPDERPPEMSIADVHARAAQNLEAFVRGGGVQWQMLTDAAGTPAMLRCHGSWLAAACCRLPNLIQFARQNLQCDEVCVSIPQREEMLLFPKGDRASRDRQRQIIREQEKDAERAITFGLFLLTEGGLVPLTED